MPLGKVTGDNIARLIREGYPRDQAIAIALSHERKENPMALKLLQTYTHGSREAKVYRNAEWSEFVVHLFENGKHQAAADYFTPDRFDAMSTAEVMVIPKEHRKRNPEHADQGPAEYSVHVDMGEHVHSVERKGNPEKGPGGSMIDTQEEVNEFLARVDEETLFASAAYGRRPNVKDWESGKDFKAYHPRWVGGPYFSIRDAQRIYDAGYRRIVIGGSEGFNVDLVVQ